MKGVHHTGGPRAVTEVFPSLLLPLNPYMMQFLPTELKGTIWALSLDGVVEKWTSDALAGRSSLL